MASLANIFLKKETLETLLKGCNVKGLKGIEITLSINDDSNKYGQNVNGFVSQSKEDREAKKEKYYVGNGSVFWTDGKVTKAQKAEDNNTGSSNTSLDSDDNLPF